MAKGHVGSTLSWHTVEEQALFSIEKEQERKRRVLLSERTTKRLNKDSLYRHQLWTGCQGKKLW